MFKLIHNKGVTRGHQKGAVKTIFAMDAEAAIGIAQMDLPDDPDAWTRMPQRLMSSIWESPAVLAAWNITDDGSTYQQWLIEA